MGLDALAPDTWDEWANWSVWGIEASSDITDEVSHPTSSTVFAVAIPAGTTSALLQIDVTHRYASEGGPVIALYELDGVAVLSQTTWNSRSDGVAWTTPGGDHVAGDPIGSASGPWSLHEIIELDFSTFATAHAGETVWLLLTPYSGGIWGLEGSAVAGWDHNPFVFS